MIRYATIQYTKIRYFYLSCNEDIACHIIVTASTARNVRYKIKLKDYDIEQFKVPEMTKKTIN